MEGRRSWVQEALDENGISRRDFLKYLGTVAALFSLPRSAVGRMAEGLEQAKKPVVLWLEFQDCAGNTESFLRASRPAVADVLLDTISLEYNETVMAAAGHQAEAAREAAMAQYAGEYVAVVEGSIPVGAGGAYCCIGGRSAVDLAREVCGQAAATIAIGDCATWGGLPAASPNPTEALSVADAVPGVKNLINLSACPANVANLTSTLVYWMSFGRWPPTDALRRPLFAYGKLIHDNCERRPHFDAGQYVEAWGDEGHRKGYCLYKMGCKGPVTYQNCPEVEWNAGTSWPIGCGHGCIGCAEPLFWDRMTPFYQHLRGIPGFGAQSDIDTVGLWAAGAVAVGFGAHGAVQALERTARKRQAKKEGRGVSGTETPGAAHPPEAGGGGPSGKGGA